MRCASVGPPHAEIAIIGEAPGREEESRGLPFIGASGYELDRMLTDAGIPRADCFVTNVVKDRPPDNKMDLWINPNKSQRKDNDEVYFRNKWVRANVKADVGELHAELRGVKPRVILALGNTALWAVTQHTSVDKWRGSTLRSNVEGIEESIVIPAYHPAFVLRQYETRYVTVSDFKRARKAVVRGIKRPDYKFTSADTYEKAKEVIKGLIALAEAREEGFKIVSDIECKRKEIICIGVGWSRTDAACIAFYGPQGRTMTAEETAEIWIGLFRLFSHKNVRLANQNIGFDIQYIFEKTGLWLIPWFDTMIAQNILFPGTPKALDYLASLYAEHYVYWKDDGKFWDKPIIFPQMWEYNCLDCVYTYEVMEAQLIALDALGLKKQAEFQMQRLFRHTLTMMFRGIRVNEARRAPLLAEVEALIGVRERRGSTTVVVKTGRLEAEADAIAGVRLDAFSWKSLQDFFYGRMGMKPVINRQTKRPTTDDDALQEIGRAEPILAPITTRINMIRSYKTAANVCRSARSPDGRWRCSFNIAGTENYRFSSSENPLGEGLNLQNLTVGKEITK